MGVVVVIWHLRLQNWIIGREVKSDFEPCSLTAELELLTANPSTIPLACLSLQCSLALSPEQRLGSPDTTTPSPSAGAKGWEEKNKLASFSAASRPPSPKAPSFWKFGPFPYLGSMAILPQPLGNSPSSLMILVPLYRFALLPLKFHVKMHLLCQPIVGQAHSRDTK